jgi:ABC-2 type transport system permease protein
MSALFSSGWSGMALLDDLDRGVLDRFLVSPASRVSLIAGRLMQGALIVVVQSVILVALALIAGAELAGGPAGVAMLILCSILLGWAFGSLSNGLALIVRREETLIAAVNLVILPLTFLCTVFMQRGLTPGWIQGAAEVNPVDWAVTAGREAVAPEVAWGVGRGPRPVGAAAGVRPAVHVVRLARVPGVSEVGLARRAGSRPEARPAPPG